MCDLCFADDIDAKAGSNGELQDITNRLTDPMHMEQRPEVIRVRSLPMETAKQIPI